MNSLPIYTALALLLAAIVGWLLGDVWRRGRVEPAQNDEARTAAILRALPDLMFVLRRDGTYLDYRAKNPGDLFVKPEQFLGKTIYEILPAELASTFAEAIARTDGSPEPVVVEYQLPMAEGTRSFEARIVSCGSDRLLSIVRDRTEQQHVQDRLRVSEARYALAIGAGGVGVWDWNVETDDLYVNPQVLSLLGYDGQPDGRTGWKRLVHPEEQERMRSVAFACLEGGGQYDVEHRMVHRDGSVRWFHTRGSVVHRADGVPGRVVGTVSDVTARKTAEEALRASDKDVQSLAGRLITAQETAHKQLARELHDDLSQRVALLAMDLDQLTHDAPDFDVRAARIRAHAAGLAQDLHGLSQRLHPFRLEAFGLVAALKALCHDVSDRAGLKVEFHHDTGLSEIAPDTALCLFRIAQEALHNVAKHSQAVRASIRLEQDGADLTLKIADSGIGFAPDAHQPAGLGLLSMRERVNLLGGKIAVHSAPGQGTRLGVRVPLRAPAATEPARVAASQVQRLSNTA